MRRFYAEPERCRGSRIELDEDESHHALRVIRVRPGDEVTVLDGAGGIYECAVESASKRTVTLAVNSSRRAEPLPYQITLVQAIPKGKVMDWIVQKATELGVSAIVPVVTERTVVEITNESAEAKARKWRAVALESIKQCGSPWLPRIYPPRPFGAAVMEVRSMFALVASLREGAKEIHEQVQWCEGKLNPPPIAPVVWVGPEGDFTSEEIETLVSKGVLPVTLGPLVLRCDTAAISFLAILGQDLRRFLTRTGIPAI